jgi:muramoyltetrapeptide carboxypeptidase
VKNKSLYVKLNVVVVTIQMITKKILANKINEGDLISIVSPSSGLAPFAMHRIEQAKKALEDMGFKVKFEANSLKNSGHVSGSVSERVSDLHSAFSNKDVKAVICTIGGNHSNQLLKFLDWKLIKKNPKIFLGYSDITVLHNAIYKKTGLITFYGPCVMPEFGEFPFMDKYNEAHLRKALVDGKIGKIIPSEEWTDEFLDWFKKDDIKRRRS